MNKLLIEDKHLDIVKSILSKYPYDFYAYGSRAKGTARKYSDLDICCLEPLRSEISKIKEDFTKSNLPFFVDLISWNKVSDSFKKLIKKDLIFLSGSKNCLKIEL